MLLKTQVILKKFTSFYFSVFCFVLETRTVNCKTAELCRSLNWQAYIYIVTHWLVCSSKEHIHRHKSSSVYSNRRDIRFTQAKIKDSTSSTLSAVNGTSDVPKNDPYIKIAHCLQRKCLKEGRPVTGSCDHADQSLIARQLYRHHASVYIRRTCTCYVSRGHYSTYQRPRPTGARNNPPLHYITSKKVWNAFKKWRQPASVA